MWRFRKDSDYKRVRRECGKFAIDTTSLDDHECRHDLQASREFASTSPSPLQTANLIDLPEFRLNCCGSATTSVISKLMELVGLGNVTQMNDKEFVATVKAFQGGIEH